MYRALLIIDPQNDFCKAPLQEIVDYGLMGDQLETIDSGGSLYVPGADQDMKRLSQFIMEYALNIDDVYVTFDDHSRLDISHPMWWMNTTGDEPDPFTVITYEDVVNGKWKSQVFEFQEWSEYYLKALDTQGNYPHVIWPYHCIAGTEGAAMVPVLADALREWEETKFKSPEIIRKGQSSLTEHYSAVKAEVITEESGTDVNMNLVQELKIYDEIVVAGEAFSHCVGNTVRDLIKYGIHPGKITILTDCTSNVPTFEKLGDDFKNTMIPLGMRFISTEEFNA